MKINDIKEVKIIRSSDRTDIEFQKEGSSMIEIERLGENYRVTVNGNETKIFETVSEAVRWASAKMEGGSPEDPEAEA